MRSKVGRDHLVMHHDGVDVAANRCPDSAVSFQTAVASGPTRATLVPRADAVRNTRRRSYGLRSRPFAQRAACGCDAVLIDGRCRPCPGAAGLFEAVRASSAAPRCENPPPAPVVGLLPTAPWVASATRGRARSRPQTQPLVPHSSAMNPGITRIGLHKRPKRRHHGTSRVWDSIPTLPRPRLGQGAAVSSVDPGPRRTCATATSAGRLNAFTEPLL